MSLRQLTSQHFELGGSKQKKILGLKVSGIALVLFKISECKGSVQFLPIFQSLAVEFKNLSFFLIDVTKNIEVLKMAKQTNDPIVNSPTVILFFNGKPVAKPVKKDLQSMRSFIRNSLSHIESKSKPKTSSVSTFMPEGVGNQIMEMKEIEFEDDPTLEIPPNIHPHNKPWETKK